MKNIFLKLSGRKLNETGGCGYTVISKNHILYRILTTVICLAMILSLFKPAYPVFAGSTIDNNTVIRTDQLGSVAGHAGDYGWDSRGAVFRYHDEGGRISGDLGMILFCNESGTPKDRMWAAWGNEFPDWWGLMLAERVRNNTSPDNMKYLRQAFADSVTFECTWVIAIGIKDNDVGSGPVYTLRVDNTLRPAYNVDTSTLDPAEKLYSGDDMTGSLSDLLEGEQWGKTSQGTFAERNPYIYRVAIDSYAVNLYATDCVRCAESGKVEGSYCEHNNRRLMLKEVPIEYGGNIYTGPSSFVWQGQTAYYHEPVIPGYRRTASKDDMSAFYGRIGNGSIVAERDSVIYFVYESTTANPTATPGPEATPVASDPSPDPSNTATPTPAPGNTTTPTPGNTTTPAPGNTATPTPIPGNTPTSGPGGTPAEPPGLTPAPTPAYAPIQQENTQAVYSPDVRDTMDTFGKAGIYSDIFDVESAIPSTESVYIKASARNIMYRINARAVSGKMPLSVIVGVPYTLKWNDEEGNEYEENGVSEATTVVYRDYSYIHLDSLELYGLENIMIANPAMSPESIDLSPGDVQAVMPAASQPVVYGSTVPSFGGNIDYPVGYSSYILSTDAVEINGEKNKPAIPLISAEEAYWTAEGIIGQLQCRNDEFKYDSRDVLGTSGWHVYGTGSLSIDMVWPEIINFDTSVLYGPDYITIPASKRNGYYRTTTRMVKYRLLASYGVPGVPYDALIEVNSINVHTPVYGEASMEECEPSITNTAFFQETGTIPTDAFILVNGRSNSLGSTGHEHDSEDFYVRFNNTGIHPVYSGKLNGLFDHLSNINGLNGGSYVEGNYLRFPFDVYMDVGNDRETSNDRLIEKDKWARCGSYQRFYLAGKVPEGYYDIEAETVAVNALGTGDRGEEIPEKVNTEESDYIAGNKMKVYISGKLYGLSLIDISSKAEWQNVFTYDLLNKYIRHIPEAAYDMNWPENDGTLKKSSVNGKYSEDEIPYNVYYYTPGTKNELGYSTGRHEKYTFPMVAGSHPDKARSNKGVLKTGYRWRFRLKTTGYEMGLAGSRVVIVPTYRIVSGKDAGYAAEIYVPDGRGKMKKMAETIEAVRVSAGSPGLQVWNFEFYLPEGCRMAAKGKSINAAGKTYGDIAAYAAENGLLDPGDDIWAEDGMIVVNFEIQAVSADGKVLYSYNAGGNSCNMWKTEGQNTDKADFFGDRYGYEYGDIALVSIKKGASSDYVTDHQN